MARPKLGGGETQRLHVMISEEEMTAIDDWRFANRVPSRSEAVRRLVQIGLVFDEHGNRIAEATLDMVQKFEEETLEATKRVADSTNENSDRQFVVDAFNLLMKSLERQENLVALLNLVFAPTVAMKSSGTYEDARLLLLAAKASSLEQLLRRKVEMYEFKRDHGMLPDTTEGKKE